MVSVYINNQPMDLLPNTVVAASFQLGDIGDIRTRYASHTNQFRIPKTSQNNRVLQFSNNINSNTEIPYIKLPARVIQNGLETIPEGTAYISSVKEYYNIVIYSDNFEFFDVIKGSTISQIDFGEGIITWDDATIDSSRKVSASALMAPVINYGNIDLTGSTFDMTDGIQLPSVRYKSIIENLIESAGYTYEGDIFTDDKYLSLIVPFSRDRFDFGGSFHKNREFKARRTTPLAVTASTVTITYDTVDLQDDYGLFNAATGVYDCDIANTSHGDARPFNFGLFAEVTFTVTSGTYRLRLNESGNVGFPAINSGNYTAGTYTVSIGYDDPTEGTLIAEADANYRIDMDPVVAGSCSITSALFYNKSYGNNFLSNPEFLVQEILPDIQQTEFMRDFAVRFGIMFKERNKTLICTRFQEIVQSPAAKDWTSKRDVSIEEELKFSLSNYAQRNYFTYPANDDEYSEGSADGILFVPNENIESEKDFFASIFSGSATKKMVNAGFEEIYCAHVTLWDTLPVSDILDHSTFDNTPGLRLALTRGAYSTEPTVSYNGNNRSDYLVAYFIDPLAPFQCAWQEAITENYTEVERALDKAKVVIRYYKLTELDIATLDLLKMVYDDMAYFIINKIENFVPGKSTKVELFRVPANISENSQLRITEDDTLRFTEEGAQRITQ